MKDETRLSIEHMAQHTRQSSWASNYVGKLETMLKELGFDEDGSPWFQ